MTTVDATCPDCSRIYWQGSHYDRLAALVEDIRRAGTTPSRTEHVPRPRR